MCLPSTILYFIISILLRRNIYKFSRLYFYGSSTSEYIKKHILIIITLIWHPINSFLYFISNKFYLLRAYNFLLKYTEYFSVLNILRIKYIYYVILTELPMQFFFITFFYWLYTYLYSIYYFKLFLGFMANSVPSFLYNNRYI